MFNKHFDKQAFVRIATFIGCALALLVSETVATRYGGGGHGGGKYNTMTITFQ